VRQTKFTSFLIYWVVPAHGVIALPRDVVRANAHDCDASVVLEIRHGD
jgi:hypothetical protein